MTEHRAFGVDLGGTKIEVGLFLLDRVHEGAPMPVGEPLEAVGLRTLVRRRIPTPAAEGYDAVLAAVHDAIRGACREAGWSDAVPMGVGMPGDIVRRTGVVKNSNTVCLNGRPFRQDLARALGRPLVFGNDANCFALAEATYGAARGERDGVVFGIIMGTGVGGGLVLRGSVWEGPQGLGGEWGHHCLVPGGLSCYCGRSGCAELYLSGPAIERAYAAATSGEPPESPRLDAVGVAAPSRVSATEVEQRWRCGEPAATRVMSAFLNAFGRGVGDVINILDPSAIVLGGGLSNLACLTAEGVEAVRQHVFNDELTTPIRRNTLGDSAGVIGAALLAG